MEKWSIHKRKKEMNNGKALVVRKTVQLKSKQFKKQ